MSSVPPPAGGFGEYSGLPADGRPAFGHYAYSALPSATYAKATLFVGVLSILGIFACLAGLLFGGIAIGMGVYSLGRIRRHPDLYSGRGYAIAGLVCGAIATGACALFAILMFVASVY